MFIALSTILFSCFFLVFSEQYNVIISAKYNLIFLLGQRRFGNLRMRDCL